MVGHTITPPMSSRTWGARGGPAGNKALGFRSAGGHQMGNVRAGTTAEAHLARNATFSHHQKTVCCAAAPARCGTVDWGCAGKYKGGGRWGQGGTGIPETSWWWVGGLTTPQAFPHFEGRLVLTPTLAVVILLVLADFLVCMYACMGSGSRTGNFYRSYPPPPLVQRPGLSNAPPPLSDVVRLYTVVSIIVQRFV